MEDGSAQSGNWQWLDFNGDRRISLEDVSGWLLHMLFLPGDVAIDLLIAMPAVAGLLHLGPDSYGGVASRTLSIMFWIAVLIVIATIYNALRDLDRAVTACVVRQWEELRRVLRITRRIFVSWIGLQLQRRRARRQHMDVAELELQKLEAAVLSCYAGLGEERVLAATDVARILRVPLRSTQQAQSSLVKYRLLQPVFETSGRNPTYQITQAGQIYMMER